jgi:hypothetical protein
MVLIMENITPPMPAKRALAAQGGAGSCPRLFSLRPSWSRSISPLLIAPRGYCHEDRPSGHWPAVCCCWAFLLRTRNRIAHMAAQCCNGRLRRGHRSRRFLPCLVRMAVSGRAHLGSRRRVFNLLVVTVSEHEPSLTQPPAAAFHRAGSDELSSVHDRQPHHDV